MTETPPDVKAHPFFSEAPPLDAKLWRYLSFPRFAYLLQTSHLHFSRVDLFDDHFEGAWPKSDAQHWEKVGQVFSVLFFTEKMRSNVAVSCWIEAPYELAAMWRLYAPGGDGVAVTTTFKKVFYVVKNGEIPGLVNDAGRVKYLDHYTDGLIGQLPAGAPYPNAYAPFTMKHRSYEHEKEVRALITSLQEIAKGGMDLPVSLSDFIDEIVISPFSDDWFGRVVTGLAELSSKLLRSKLARDLFYIGRGNP